MTTLLLTTTDGLTKKQAAMFWRTFGAACSEQGIRDKDARETYRRRVLLETTGKLHMGNLNRTRDYERVMMRLCQDAGDYEGACRYVGGNEKRIAALVEACLWQVMDLATIESALKVQAPDSFACRNDGIQYVLAICKQAGIRTYTGDSQYWMDISKGLLSSVFKMLDTHRRRMLKRCAPDMPLKFDMGTQYFMRGGVVKATNEATEAPSAFKVKVVV